MLNPELNYLPDEINTIHIMGICGTGMAALAGMLKKSGYRISGSDGNVYPPMSTYLEQIDIHPFEGYQAGNLSHSPDLVIVGNVITKKNPEAIALAELNLPYLSFPQALAEFFIRGKQSFVITGTHGKTTTCSLLASSLYHASKDPSFMIGGIVSEFKANNRVGKGDYFVSEGDEYDTAFFDKESKFLHYRPDVAIITSIEFDHADIFDDLEQIKQAFIKFVQLLPEDGLIIANLDDEVVREVVQHARCTIQGYGFQAHNDWQISNIETERQLTTFSLEFSGQNYPMQIPMSGHHNCLNATAVSALLHSIDMRMDDIVHCLMQFSGVKRRQEIRGEENGITVIDDFAHHPTAVKETLAGLRKAYEGRRLVSVFEPRTNSSRRAIFQSQYAESFGAADAVLLREPIPLKNVPNDNLFSSRQLAMDLQGNIRDVWAFETTEEILAKLEEYLKPGDVVAILSNGGFDNIHERLLDILRSQVKTEE